MVHKTMMVVIVTICLHKHMNSKGHAKPNSPHQSHSPNDMYKCHGYSITLFTYDHLWKSFPCMFFHASNHYVVECKQWKELVKKKDQIIGKRHEEPLLGLETYLSMGSVRTFIPIAAWMGTRLRGVGNSIWNFVSRRTRRLSNSLQWKRHIEKWKLM